MENGKTESTKRQSTTNNAGPSSKVQRRPVQETTIVDLNDDCLSEIFDYLELKCLLSVAVANEWLRPAAVDVYKRKRGAKRLEIGECGDYRRNTRSKTQLIRDSAPREFSDSIYIYGLKMCLQYLRCFGSTISNLTLNYFERQSKRYQHVHNYINAYCTTSLVEFTYNAR